MKDGKPSSGSHSSNTSPDISRNNSIGKEGVAGACAGRPYKDKFYEWLGNKTQAFLSI